MALLGRRNPTARPPRTPEAPPSLNTEDALGGVNWDSYRQQGPERNPRPVLQPWKEMSTGRQWHDHWDAEEKALREKHYDGLSPLEGMTRGKINDVLADPKFDEIQRGRELLQDTHGFRHGGVNYQPLELMRSDRWLYNKNEAEEEQTGLDSLRNITSRRSLPEGFSTHVNKEASGNYTARLYDTTKEVGRVSWNGDTGHVHNLSIDEEKHRILLAHLLDKAHGVSHENGDTGPTHSNTLSAYSYKLMKKYAPSFIPDDATVEEEDEHMYEHSVYAHQDAVRNATHHWNIAKTHLLKGEAQYYPRAVVEIKEHDEKIAQLGIIAKQGRLHELSDVADDASHSSSRLLYSSYARENAPAVDGLVSSSEHLNKLANKDFHEELYGH